PTWIQDARQYFTGVTGVGSWKTLVNSWLTFEHRLGYPDGSRANWLASKGRLEEIKQWIKKAHPYKASAVTINVKMFSGTWKGWWRNIQPVGCVQGVEWPLLQNVEQDLNWMGLDRGGCNGMFLVIVSLSWW
ncbi:uncharacterized protein LAESUDRAFT_606537, partial [Laetiporus sulphureus 93-53]